MNIAQLEEISLNALPAQQTFLYDGWVIRMSAGYSRRANSVQTYGAPAQGVLEKIAYCEKLYRAHNLPVIFKLTNASQPADLDEILETRGYRHEAHTYVQTCALDSFPASENARVHISEQWDEKWYDEFCRMNGTSPAQRTALEKILKSLVPQTAFASVPDNGKVIACGLGVLQETHLGLFDIVVDGNARRRGWGKQLVVGLMQWGKANGARTAYLQVVGGNTPALNMYANLGFVEQYAYWYRVRV